jgi:hypothetical protein
MSPGCYAKTIPATATSIALGSEGVVSRHARGSGIASNTGSEEAAVLSALALNTGHPRRKSRRMNTCDTTGSTLATGYAIRGSRWIAEVAHITGRTGGSALAAT